MLQNQGRRKTQQTDTATSTQEVIHSTSLSSNGQPSKLRSPRSSQCLFGALSQEVKRIKTSARQRPQPHPSQGLASPTLAGTSRDYHEETILRNTKHGFPTDIQKIEFGSDRPRGTSRPRCLLNPSVSRSGACPGNRRLSPSRSRRNKVPHPPSSRYGTAKALQHEPELEPPPPESAPWTGTRLVMSSTAGRFRHPPGRESTKLCVASKKLKN